jgi:hypothetical protein
VRHGPRLRYSPGAPVGARRAIASGFGMDSHVHGSVSRDPIRAPHRTMLDAPKGTLGE